MTDRKEILKILQDLKDEIKGIYHVKNIGLFGSFIRDEQKRESDIDVLVDFDEKADFFDLVGLSLFLEDKIKESVDVIPQRALRKELKDAILKEVSFI